MIDHLINFSKDWLKEKLQEESRNKNTMKSIFPNLAFIFSKIQKFCSEKQIVLFDFPKIIPPPVKTGKEMCPIQKKESATMVKKCTKRRINFVSTAKWDSEQLTFPPLQAARSVHIDCTEKLDFEKIVMERSLKSTVDTNENKSVLPTIDHASNTFACEMKNSENLDNQSISALHKENRALPRVDDKELLSKSNLTFQNDRKNSGSFEKIDVSNIKVHFENPKDRNSKSANKSNDVKSGKSKTKNETQKKSKAALQHSSPPKKKANDQLDCLDANKTSIEVNKITKSEDNKKNNRSTKNDDLSTFTSDIVLDNGQKHSKIEHFIEENHDGLTNLDLMILNSMNKCYTVFERSTSRYNFVKDAENQESSDKIHPCQKFTNLIQSFLEEDNPLSKSGEAHTSQNDEQPTKCFRLFDQSYTLKLARHTS